MKYLIPILLLLLASITICVDSRYNEGHIDVEAQFADFNNFQANAYMLICIIKSGYNYPLPLDHSVCTLQCSSHQSPYTDHPVWRESCLPSDDDITFLDKARIVVEIWSTNNKKNKKKALIDEKPFLGGNSITVKELLRSGQNGQSWKFPLYDGLVRGYGVVRINWTPV